jgi:hypothetical protein
MSDYTENLRKELFSGDNNGRNDAILRPIVHPRPQQQVQFKVEIVSNHVDLAFSVPVSNIQFSPEQATQIGQLMIHYGYKIAEKQQVGRPDNNEQ